VCMCVERGKQTQVALDDVLCFVSCTTVSLAIYKLDMLRVIQGTQRENTTYLNVVIAVGAERSRPVIESSYC